MDVLQMHCSSYAQSKLCIAASETRGKSEKGKIELHDYSPEKKMQYFRTFDPKAASKKFQFKILNEEKMNYALLKAIAVEIRNALDLKIARKPKIFSKERTMMHHIC